MRALVLSGGGSKGAYQVGALRVLLGMKQTQYDILCGVSVGAINCAHLAMYSLGKERDAKLALEALWCDLSTDKVYKRWFPLGRVHGLWKTSFYDSTPLRELLRQRIDVEKVREAKRILRIGAVSLDTGLYKLFSGDVPELLPDIVAASAAYPVMLTPTVLDGQLFSDGGIRNVTPIGAAIDLGADEIDVVVTAARDPKRTALNKPNAIDIAERTVDIMAEEIIENDISMALMYNRLVACGGAEGKRHIEMRIIRPDVPLRASSLKFDHDRIMAMMDAGEEDATKVVGE